ncbi:hypothetical protein GLAREA_12221 [Glarea lozoyensis ATCC 20868]|uniref:Uncharacterized protein n=1 Tax=Glarea lozoyensis (strain ATCC 20868 / MF5171) TaxID=1116229 RepID=S3D4V8_GLAL2|nr:uncharacterized protein GLAREA_12221 [Glarea lozoyensis ATCC 20868]EPE32139.1 hypothetical protein GLAREA_12221 [Glarea lozoyensis ATCC 20868]
MKLITSTILFSLVPLIIGRTIPRQLAADTVDSVSSNLDDLSATIQVLVPSPYVRDTLENRFEHSYETTENGQDFQSQEIVSQEIMKLQLLGRLLSGIASTITDTNDSTPARSTSAQTTQEPSDSFHRRSLDEDSGDTGLPQAISKRQQLLGQLLDGVISILDGSILARLDLAGTTGDLSSPFDVNLLDGTPYPDSVPQAVAKRQLLGQLLEGVISILDGSILGRSELTETARVCLRRKQKTKQHRALKVIRRIMILNLPMSDLKQAWMILVPA